MKLAVHMNEQTIKQIKGFLTCCAKIGTVLLIEASPSQMRWRTINSAKSCCILITLESSLFQHYVLYTVSSMNASVLLKHFLSAIRTPKIKRVEMEIQDGDLLTITVDSESGLHKKYKVACVDEEHLVATFDRDTLPTSITADAFQLYKVLTSFQTSLDEVTLLARPEGNGNMQPIQLASYVPPAKQKLHQRKGGLLRTHIQIDTRGRQLFKHYRTSSDEILDATFNVKDFAVLVQLCKQVQADVAIHMGHSGTPLLAEASWSSTTTASASHVAAEILLATIGESVQDALADMPALGNTQGATRGTPGGVLTPAAVTPAPSTIRAAAEAARATAAATPRGLEPATVAAHTRMPPAGPARAALASPATAPRQPLGQTTGQTAGPSRGSGTQSVARDSYAPAHTPPNLGGHDWGVRQHAGRTDDRVPVADVPAAARVQGPLETGSAPGSLAWGSAAHTSQDSSPHVDATFRVGVGAICAEATAAPPERVQSAGVEATVGDGAAGAEDGAGAWAEQAAVAPEERVVRGTGGVRAETSRFASHLERLAAAIRQDEHIRNAQKASMEAAVAMPSEVEDVEKVNMQAQEQEDGEPQDESEGEFAVDDDEEDCLATPPDARPETVFM